MNNVDIHDSHMFVNNIKETLMCICGYGMNCNKYQKYILANNLKGIDLNKLAHYQDQLNFEIEELNNVNLFTNIDGLKRNNFITKLQTKLEVKNKIIQELKLENTKIKKLEMHNNEQNNLITKLQTKLEAKNKIIQELELENVFLQEITLMQLEDKDYISENKLLKNKMNDQEEIIKQLLERLEQIEKNSITNSIKNKFEKIWTNLQ